MRKLLLVLGLIFGGFAIAKSQNNSIRFDRVVLPPEIYQYEAVVHMYPNILIRFITPKEDTVYIGNTVQFSSEKAPNFLNNCVSGNLDTLGIKSILVVVIQNLNILWSKELPSRGQSEVIWKRIPLPSGDVLILREIYRRRFDCEVYLWYTIEEFKRGT